MTDQPDFLEKGLIIPVNKPKTWSSFHAVKKIRFVVSKALGKKVKVGHAGTLDPLADGVLIICIGKATKTISELQDLPKEYTGIIRLGATTPSFDLETEVDKEFPYESITLEEIRAAAQKLTGPLMQHPPIFSARWIDGQRAYTLARQGVTPKIESRPVIVNSFEIPEYTAPDAKFIVKCSKGTYIRSLARDLGALLETGGHLASLTRTAIGPYRIEDCLDPTDITLEKILMFKTT